MKSGRRSPFDLRHPFFNPLWRRIAVTAFTALWAAFEFVIGSQLWPLFFGAVAAWLFWSFLIAWDGPVADPRAQDEAGDRKQGGDDPAARDDEPGDAA